MVSEMFLTRLSWPPNIFAYYLEVIDPVTIYNIVLSLSPRAIHRRFGPFAHNLAIVESLLLLFNLPLSNKVHRQSLAIVGASHCQWLIVKVQ